MSKPARTELRDRIVSMATNLKLLPIDEKLRLVQDLWESIAADASSVPVNPDHLKEVEERLAKYRIDGDRGAPVRDVVERVRNEL